MTWQEHVRVKSAGDEVAGSREGPRGCKWDTLVFNYYFNKWV